jgi:hypothetical protein
VRAEAGGDAAAATRTRELLHPDGIVHVIAALAAVLGLVLESEEAELAAAVVELPWELARLLPLVDVGGDLVGDESPGRLPQLLVLLAEGREEGPLTGVLDDAHPDAGSDSSPSSAFCFASAAGGFQSSSIV